MTSIFEIEMPLSVMASLYTTCMVSLPLAHMPEYLHFGGRQYFRETGLLTRHPHQRSEDCCIRQGLGPRPTVLTPNSCCLITSAFRGFETPPARSCRIFTQRIPMHQGRPCPANLRFRIAATKRSVTCSGVSAI